MKKVIDTPTLKKMITRSRNLRFNRQMTKQVENHLDPYGRHILTHSFVHGDVECVRCLVLAKMRNKSEPEQGMLDFSFDDFNRIPEYKEKD